MWALELFQLKKDSRAWKVKFVKSDKQKYFILTFQISEISFFVWIVRFIQCNEQKTFFIKSKECSENSYIGFDDFFFIFLDWLL